MRLDTSHAAASVHRRIALAVALALAACASDPQPSATPPPPPEGAAEAYGARPGVSLAEILSAVHEGQSDGSLAVLDRLAEPGRIEAEPVENRHLEGQTDTLRTLVYDGLQLEVYETAEGKQLVREVRVTGRGYETADGIQVGSRRSAVRRLFGAAVSSQDSVVYLIESGPDAPASTTLRLRFEGHDLAEMTWSFYVD